MGITALVIGYLLMTLFCTGAFITACVVSGDINDMRE
jgi:hypothetical protein